MKTVTFAEDPITHVTAALHKTSGVKNATKQVTMAKHAKVHDIRRQQQWFGTHKVIRDSALSCQIT